MKYKLVNNNILVVLIIIITSVILYGCSTNDESANISATDIIGEWNHTKCVGFTSDLYGNDREDYEEDCRNAEMGLIFRRDKTGTNIDGGYCSEFKYEIKSDTLIIYWTNYPNDKPLISTIKKLTSKELVIHTYTMIDLDKDWYYPNGYISSEYRYHERK